MKDRLEHFRFTLPLRDPVRIDRTEITEREIRILRLTRADGRIGYGEASPLPELSTDSATSLRWGVAGARRMAETTDWAPPVRVPVHGLIPARISAPEAVEAAGKFSDAGYTHVKIKVGGRELTDIHALLREVVARTRLRLRLDGGGRLKFSEAAAIAREFAANIDYFEEPFQTGEPESETRQRFFAETGVACAIDLRELPIRALSPHPGLRAIVAKPTLLGAIPTGAPVIFSSAYESALGLYQAAVHASAVPGPHGLDTTDIFTDPDFPIGPVERRGGYLVFPPVSAIRQRLHVVCQTRRPSEAVTLET